MEWKDKVVLVTGGTGSFGRKFIEVLLARHSPRKIIVFSRDELKQVEMQQDRRYSDQGVLRFFLGDVRDKERLARAFDGVDVVVHAAALKQVPAAEYNPFEVIKTNVLGAQNIIECAIDKDVKKVVALSTDKAANPINLYGATKLCSDKLFVAGNAYVGRHGTVFSVVRYGNVVGSRGSVIPIFISQRQNGKLTITDERMTRFWLTLEQGVRFVIHCAEQMVGGEVFVPKIPSTRIVDLAQAIAPHSQIEIVGIRPGEKLHEVLIHEDEARTAVELDDMFVVLPTASEIGFAQACREAWLGRGRSLPDGFRYGSETNPHWLSLDEIRSLIEPFEAVSGLGKLA